MYITIAITISSTIIFSMLIIFNITMIAVMIQNFTIGYWTLKLSWIISQLLHTKYDYYISLLSYHYYYQSQGSGPSGSTSLGDFSPCVSMGHTSSASTGGRSAEAARRSRGSRPTKRQRVAYQSAMCRRPGDDLDIHGISVISGAPPVMWTLVYNPN